MSFLNEDGPPGPTVVVFDFDGTLTEPEKGADDVFITAHATGLAELLNRDPVWAIEQYARIRRMIEADPATYGWQIERRIVAPALVDACVAAKVCAQIMLSELGENVEEWRSHLEKLYQEHYLKLKTRFREDVLATLDALRAKGVPFCVVSNSDPTKVCKRLDALGPEVEWLKPLVRGFAKKFVVTDGPWCLPEFRHFKGLKRRVYLRKQHYYDVLSAIMDVYGTRWGRLVCVGDIAELDLTLPATMGANIRLIVGPHTPEYEVRWVATHPRGQVISSLTDVLATFP